MADFSDELKTRLKAVGGVTALVGSGTSARIYADVLKENCTMPAILYYESGGESSEYLQGIAGRRRAVYHVLAYGATRAAANELADTIRTKALNTNFRGLFGSTRVDTVSCSTNRNSGFETLANNTYRYWCERVYDIWHAEETS